MGKALHYQEMPKAIQQLVDGAEFLIKVERVKRNGKIIYKFTFQDSFETWARLYDGSGNKVCESPFIARWR